MVQFLSINVFSWISSIFVGFFRSSRFFVSPCISAIPLFLVSFSKTSNFPVSSEFYARDQRHEVENRMWPEKGRLPNTALVHTERRK